MLRCEVERTYTLPNLSARNKVSEIKQMAIAAFTDVIVKGLTVLSDWRKIAP